MSSSTTSSSSSSVDNPESSPSSPPIAREISLRDVTLRLHEPLDDERYCKRVASVLRKENFAVAVIEGQRSSTPAIKAGVFEIPGTIVLQVYPLYDFVNVYINCPFYNVRSEYRRAIVGGDAVGTSLRSLVERAWYASLVYRLIREMTTIQIPESMIRVSFADMRAENAALSFTKELFMCGVDMRWKRDPVLRTLSLAWKRRRLQRKLVALFMGRHARLGADSLLMLLPDFFMELFLVPAIIVADGA